LRVPSTPTVVDWIQSPLKSPSAAWLPTITSRTASASVIIVRITSTDSIARFALSQASTPSLRSGAMLASLMSHARTEYPDRAKCVARGAPIMPTPRTATLRDFVSLTAMIYSHVESSTRGRRITIDSILRRAGVAVLLAVGLHGVASIPPLTSLLIQD